MLWRMLACCPSTISTTTTASIQPTDQQGGSENCACAVISSGAAHHGWSKASPCTSKTYYVVHCMWIVPWVAYKYQRVTAWATLWPFKMLLHTGLIPALSPAMKYFAFAKHLFGCFHHKRFIQNWLFHRLIVFNSQSCENPSVLILAKCWAQRLTVNLLAKRSG